jgi:peptidyl-prolyl cis-trans isomerase D
MAKKKASNVFVWIMLLLLIMGLAGFSVTNFGGSVRSVATVGDTEVEIDDYARALQNQMAQYQRLTGQPLSLSDARALGFDRAALATLIGEAAIKNATAEAGLSVGDDNVGEEIRKSPNFQGLSGSFDRDTYELTLRQNNMTTREFENRVRESISADILRQAVIRGVRSPDLFTNTIYAFARETRDVTWARLTIDDLEADLPEPTEADLTAFHAENPGLFTQGETRVISYAWLTPDMIVDQIDVDDDQLRALYDARADEYQQPERRLVERLVFATEEAALGAFGRIEAGEATFDALVEDRGLTLEDVDLGETTLEDLGPAGPAIFALVEPGTLGPLDSDLGPALFRVNAILSAQSTSFEEARAELADEAAADRARRIIADQIATVEDLLAGGATMDVLAERTDMEAGMIDWRPEVSDGVAAYDAFRTAAETAEAGGFAQVVELDDGGIVALQLTEVRPPELLPLDAVRDDVADAWRTRGSGLLLTAEAERLAETLRGGREMAGLGLALETDRNLERQGFVVGTPADFIDQVFDMEENDIRVLSADGDAWLVRLDAVRAPDPDAPEAQIVRLQFSADTRDEIAQNLLTAFTQAILDYTDDVSVNQTALNAVHAQMQ